MQKSREYYSVTIYDPSVALHRLKEQHITVYHFQKVEEYTYEFATPPGSKKKVLALFPDAIFLRYTGTYSILYHLWVRKTTLLALILSTLFFFVMSDRIYDVDVIGTSRNITAMIEHQLDQIGLKKYTKKPNYSQLLTYEKKLKEIFYEEIEFIEVRMVGVCLRVQYTKRRTSIDLPYVGESLYAKKNGLIAYFKISSGEVMVKENQYVKEGDLLVKETITTAQGEEIYVGTEGQVYAWTWTIIDVESRCLEQEEESELFARLLGESETMMAAGFYEDEHIEKETILSFEIIDQIGYLKVHFTCLEDIAH